MANRESGVSGSEVFNGFHENQDLMGHVGTEAPTQPPVDLPIADYARWVVYEAPDLRVTDADDHTDPSRYRGPAWQFARYMKAHPEFADLDARAALRLANYLLSKMCPSAEDPWEDALGDCDSFGNPVAAYDHFYEAWNVVTYAMGDGPMEHSLRQADRELAVPERGTLAYALRNEFPGKRECSFRRLVLLMYHLVGDSADPVAFLPVEKIGALLECSPQQASLLRKKAVREGFLELVRKVSPTKRLIHSASRSQLIWPIGCLSKMFTDNGVDGGC